MGSRNATTLPGGATGVVFAEPVPSPATKMPPPQSGQEVFTCRQGGGRVSGKFDEAFSGVPVLAGHQSSGNWPAYDLRERAGHPMVG